MHTVYLALGTNLGDRHKAIREAVRRIGEEVGTVERESSLFETKPWGFVSDHDFINTAIKVSTPLSPRSVLKTTQHIEKEMGRTGKSTHHQYHDRIIDIDILLYDDLKINEPDLQIPHPLMRERDFVMRPLQEILK